MAVKGARQSPHRVAFARAKYGRLLLADAGYVTSFAGFVQDGRPHVLDFFDILLITRGRGVFLLDGERHEVHRGRLFLTRPGQVRQWRVQGLEGACIFFREEFVAETFSDPHLLEQFPCFTSSRPSGALDLSRRQRHVYLRRFEEMRSELACLKSDTPHALRAWLYDVLVLINRFYAAQHGEVPRRAANTVVERFRTAVQQRFRQGHRVAEYATALGVTPGHLNVLCKAALGTTAATCIRQRVVLEAKRLLCHTNRTTREIGYQLGFDDPSYFVRYIKRETGLTPMGLRRRARQ